AAGGDQPHHDGHGDQHDDQRPRILKQPFLPQRRRCEVHEGSVTIDEYGWTPMASCVDFGRYTGGMSERIRHIIGCMTGTSLDGLDAVLTRVIGEGLDMRAEFVAMINRPLGDLAEVLRP